MDSLSVPATLESLKTIRDFVGKAAHAAGLSQARTYGLALAVDEIATNIITHGYEETGRTQGWESEDIRIHASITGSALEITLEDTGTPFDPRSRPAPDDLHAPLAERDAGGLGIFLALKKVDDFRYDYVAGRNRNILVIRTEHPNNLPANRHQDQIS
jgi:anti-sigma regulatory factor (Ser/Thr protein kinase)